MAVSTYYYPSPINYLLFALIVSCRLAAPGAEYYVSPDGDDLASGTLAHPWRTVQKAADSLAPGDAVYARGGLYEERVTVNVSGDATSGPVTFAAYPGETPILDGTSLTVPDDDNAMFLLVDREYVVIDGFEIRNYRTSVRHRVPAGILALGACRHVTIRNNHLHHIETNATVDGDRLGADAFGIGVFGTRAPQAARDITIADNELHDLKTGSSESLVVNGNVEGFVIGGNTIHHVDNIAIDCIGYEGTSPDDNHDIPENGKVLLNSIHDISGVGNPAYPDPYGALGIYVDGAREIVIERNSILRADFGIEVSCEHRDKVASGVVVQSNIVAGCRTAGLSIGGLEANWGGAENCVFVNNTFYRNNSLEDGHGEIVLLKYIDGIELWNNIVYANADKSFVLQEKTSAGRVELDSNLYASDDGDADGFWMWAGVEYDTFAEFRAASGGDAQSLVADPAFVAPAADDLRLSPGSPAIDEGYSDALPAVATRDFDGLPRVLDGDGDGEAVVDIGAHEFGRQTPFAFHWLAY